MSDDLRDLYQDLILDHGKKPHNFRKPASQTHEAVGHNPLCGDRLVLYVMVDGTGKITDAAFQGTGCAISMASASIMTDVLKGKTLSEAEALISFVQASCTGAMLMDTPKLDEDDTLRIEALSGVRHYPVRVKCATLAWHTLRAALKGAKETSTETTDAA